jgi:hypothetical protein
MAAVVQRIVVQTTAQEQKAIATKAKKLRMPISELMRRGALAYEPSHTDQELAALAEAAERGISMPAPPFGGQPPSQLTIRSTHASTLSRSVWTCRSGRSGTS